MTMTLPFDGRTRISFRAVGVAERIDLRELERTGVIATNPLMIKAGDHGAAVVFRYGVVVLYDMTPVEEVSFLGHLASFMSDRHAEPETEDGEILVDPSARQSASAGVIRIQAMDTERLQLIADIIARSISLVESETSVAAVFDRIEPLALSLQQGAGRERQAKELLRHIGGTLMIQHKMVGRVEVDEKPELLWENPQLERFYYRLSEEYELRERHRALEHKLALISRTAETMLGLLHHRSSMRVEWYIVLLIVAEIIIMVGEMLFLT